MMEIKKIWYPTRLETLPDIYNDNIDVHVSLDDEFCDDHDRFCYVLVVGTPQNLSELMDQWETDFFPPVDPPFIIVRKLTEEIIEQAIRAFVDKKEDAYWLKLYHVTSEIDIRAINAAIDRLKND